MIKKLLIIKSFLKKEICVLISVKYKKHMELKGSLESLSDFSSRLIYKMKEKTERRIKLMINLLLRLID
jgi:hypothetical protein